MPATSAFDPFTITLAQGALPGEPGAGGAVTGAPGNATGGLPGAPGGAPGPGGAAAPPGLFDGPFLFLMLGVLLLMIVMSVRGQRRERKKREALMESLKKHDRVQTVGGVIGAIVEVKPDFVVLKVDESSNTRITFARSAIQQVLGSKDAHEPTALGN